MADGTSPIWREETLRLYEPRLASWCRPLRWWHGVQAGEAAAQHLDLHYFISGLLVDCEPTSAGDNYHLQSAADADAVR